MGTYYDKSKAQRDRQAAANRTVSPLQALLQTPVAAETENQNEEQAPVNAEPVPPQSKTMYQSNQEFLDSMVNPPLDPKEVDKRKAAATKVAAVGQFGNLMSAFANLAGTSRGAAPQDIPGYQGPDIESWQDKAAKRQQEYMTIMNGLNAQDWEQAYKDRQLAMQEAERQQKQQNWKAEQEQKQANWQAEQDFNKEKFEEAKRQNAAELESLDKYRRGQVAANQTRANNTGTRSSGTPNNDTISSGGYSYTFNRREGNNATWEGMYQAIPREWLSSLPSGEQIHYYDSTSDIGRKQRELIIRYAQEHPEYMEDMMNKYPNVISRSRNQAEDTFDLNDNSDTFDLNN